MNEISVAGPTRHKLDSVAYFQMGELGIFGDNGRIELIDGELIDMAPIGQSHESIVGSLNRALVLACLDRAIVWPQNSLRLDYLNVPQPDFALLRPRDDFYATGERPRPGDVFVLIEVADSSLPFDTKVKLPLYAKAAIAELWIVDVKRRALDAYRRPEGDGYAERTTHRAGERLALASAPEIVVPLQMIFGP